MVINFRYFTIYLKNNPKRIELVFQRVKDNPDWYKKDYQTFKDMMGDAPDFPVLDNFPCLDEKNNEAGSTRSHYFIQDLYFAQKIYRRCPQKHVDVGSRIDGFVAHIASFREIELLDIRNLDSDIQNVTFRQADVMEGGNVPVDYCDSISSLHALEHFGLGRYGDPIDPEGHLKGFRNITKMLRKGGHFYFSVPMGRQRIEFNAHRVFGMLYLLNMVSKDYEIISFSYIDDKGTLHRDVSVSDVGVSKSFGCKFGCALFELRKNNVKG